jgi:hypothetical protein
MSIYDKSGTRIDALEWGRLNRDRDYSQIGETFISSMRISTVWLGIDHNHSGSGAPIIFETMFFGGPLDCSTVARYSNEEDARETHAMIVESFRHGDVWATVVQAARAMTNGRERHGWVKWARDQRRHAAKSATLRA